ncbi:glycosyltransferase family 2 protein [Vibrio neonatus]|uniref:glycosyltransferase family 2 protein n=1 Tax=Vibrio neonatus TaxID=278860 RepID=UPI0021C49BB3|nr:glycosyltransferase family 2 protein [Vibrio neonatus]
MQTYQPCFLIPCYNHGSTIDAVVASLEAFALPCIVVDDGSDSATKQALQELANSREVILDTLAENSGKGGAVMAGIRKAHQLGYSHIIQIDADGQHDVDALPKLIASSKAHPTRLISGQPIYDASVPKSRLYGRYATHIWVWIETLSLAIKDSMCGFRAYPVAKTVAVLDKYCIGQRMDFDIEILVRMYWEGVDIDFVETRVIYPESGISHFDALWDNVKISWMHTRLFFGMLPRIPKLLARHWQKPSNTDKTHWSKRQEQGTVLGIKLMLAIYSLLGRKVFNLILKVVIRYYHLTGKDAKLASEQFLQQLQNYATTQGIVLPKPIDSYHHLLSFGHTMLDKLAAWKGDFNSDNLTIHGKKHFPKIAQSQRGVILIGSHLGNIELCRALARKYSHVKINALVFTEHAERFNTVMKAVNANSDLNLIQVSRIGPDTAILLQQKIEAGEWVVIVGDRTSTSKESRSVWADFLGKPAPFPQGPFLLASVLKAPVYLLFGLRDDSSDKPLFDVYFEPFSDKIILPRKERQQALQNVVQSYADRLQHYTLQAPLQWYNFFNFWTLSDQKDDREKH